VHQGNKVDNPLLVIVGMAGSGKSTIAYHLKQKGWHIVHFGEITMRELDKRGLPISEANEKAIREELRTKDGMAAYARLSLEEIQRSLMKTPTLIDGMYSWSEYRFLKNQFGGQMAVLAVFTTRFIRYERLSRRPKRPLTAEEAEKRDFAEIENVEKGGPIAMADYTLVNDGTEEELLQEFDRLLDERILTKN
jgi:dephospho-CoA kinase